QNLSSVAQTASPRKTLSLITQVIDGTLSLAPTRTSLADGSSGHEKNQKFGPSHPVPPHYAR
ncbi:hypothetical protein TNIN_480401, partial [Trichonephila inaurata madagascariensis]